jgi:hypothetical protein
MISFYEDLMENIEERDIRVQEWTNDDYEVEYRVNLTNIDKKTKQEMTDVINDEYGEKISNLSNYDYLIMYK